MVKSNVYIRINKIIVDSRNIIFLSQERASHLQDTKPNLMTFHQERIEYVHLNWILSFIIIISLFLTVWDPLKNN